MKLTTNNTSSEEQTGTVVPDTVEADGGPRPFVLSSENRLRLLIATNALSIAVAVILLFGLIYSWSSTSELRRIRAELSDLQEFEDRITDKINLMNTGFQKRLEGTDDRIERLRSEVMTLNATLKETGAYLEDEIRDLRADTQAMSGAAASGGNSLPSGVPSVTVESGSPSFQSSAQFRRVVTPDGKVRYEKRR